MEIHFFWINDFPPFKKSGINLSARFVIEWNEPREGDQQQLPKLSISYNPDYIPNFFHNEKVLNVSAIIGQNGSGKSSILNYIKQHLPEGLEANVLTDLFVYSVITGGKEHYYVIESSEFPVVLEDSTGLFEKGTYGEITHNDPLRFTAHLSDAEYIYYSYFVEHQVDATDWGGLRDISTSKLLVAEHRRLFQENWETTSFGKMAETSDLDLLNLSEIAKAIQFFNSSESNRLPFPKPEKLFVSINTSDRGYFFEGRENHSDVVQLLAELESRRNANTIKAELIEELLWAIFINFLMDERKYSMNSPYYHLIDIGKDESITDYIGRFFKEMSDIQFTFENKPARIPSYEQKAKLIPEFITLILTEIDNGNFVPFRDNNKVVGFQLLLNKESDQAFSKFRNYYLRIKGINTFFDFKWRSLSTGEQSYLSFMARFYHLKYHEHNELKKDLVILIDEGDAGYHPEWQRKFFAKTLEYLTDLFKDHSLQLIFTANTPFLSSDLPKAHVLFIEKRDGLPSIFTSKNNTKAETFGANIHTLLSDSFYMSGVLIGDFAKTRIDEIIDYLNDDQITEPNDEYKKTIDQIGEPIVRRKLEMMWNDKFGLDEELKQLRKRILEIEAEQEQKNKKNKKKG